MGGIQEIIGWRGIQRGGLNLLLLLRVVCVIDTGFGASTEIVFRL